MFERMRLGPIHDFRFTILDKIDDGIRIDLFVQRFANHAHWRRAAACQAFYKLNAVFSIGADGDGIMFAAGRIRPVCGHSLAIGLALDSKLRAHVFH